YERCGVVVLEGALPESRLAPLARLATLAGPVLARAITIDTAQRSGDKITSDRDRLTLIVNSLPDPIVITDASNDIIVQNARAGHLLEATENDSEGRRRAVELNNLLFSSFLSRTVMSGRTTSGPRELNLVDPSE